MLKRVLLYVVVMLILLALAVSAGQWGKGTALLEQQATEISTWLVNQGNEAKKGNGPGTFLVHSGDSLISWTNTNVIPSKRDLKFLSEKTGYLRLDLPQGYFLCHVEQHGTETHSTLVPIQYNLNFNRLAEKNVS